MEITKEKALEELDKIREALINSSSPEDIMDDGSDNCDVEQNERFSKQYCNIESINAQLAKMDIQGVDYEVLNTMWSRSYGNGLPHLPEVRYNHCIEYIDSIKRYFNDKEYANLINELSSPEE